MNPPNPTSAPPLLAVPPAHRRNTVTWKLLFIAGLVLLLQLPLSLINDLRQERERNRAVPAQPATQPARAIAPSVRARDAEGPAVSTPTDSLGAPAEPAEGYRMVERALKHSVLVLALTFTAFFLFETLAGLRLHPVHYGLVGAALALFYLALLALGEVLSPGWAYVGAAVASSALIVSYSVSVLQGYGRAGTVAALLTAEHSVLYVVLRMENYALLAGTAALFVALGLVMFCTRRINWYSLDAPGTANATGAAAQ